MVKKKYLTLNDITAYKKSFKLSNYVWKIVISWDYFEKKTIGIQYVRSIDSISSNIAEGFGRYTKKDKINFYRYSFGSIKESLDWNEKAKNRNLTNNKDYQFILDELKQLQLEVNHLISYTNRKLTK